MEKNNLVFSPISTDQKSEGIYSFETEIKKVESLYNKILDNNSMGSFSYQIISDSNSLTSFFQEKNEWLSQNPDVEMLRQKSKNLALLAEQIVSFPASGFSFSNLCSFVDKKLTDLCPVLNGIKAGLQILLISGEFLHILQEMYLFSIQSNSNLFHYAYIGAKRLDLNWYSYGRRLYSSINRVSNLNTTQMIASLVKWVYQSTGRGNIISPTDLSRYSSAIALADYAYCKTDYPSDGENSPVRINLLSNCIIADYDENTLQFQYGLGLRGAIASFEDDNRIYLAFSGSKNLTNWVTNIIQILSSADSVYLAALGIASELRANYPTRELVIVGHSLGGGLAQFSASLMLEDNVTAIGFNSAGLSKGTIRILNPNKQKCNNAIIHIVSKYDFVWRLGSLLGKRIEVQTCMTPIISHRCAEINRSVNGQNMTYCCRNNNSQNHNK